MSLLDNNYKTELVSREDDDHENFPIDTNLPNNRHLFIQCIEYSQKLTNIRVINHKPKMCPLRATNINKGLEKLNLLRVQASDQGHGFIATLTETNMVRRVGCGF